VAERGQTVPLIGGVVVFAALLIYGVQKYVAKVNGEPSVVAAPVAPAVAPTLLAAPAPSTAVAAALTGAAVDLSTVMGRARKLANAWQADAALVGIEATLADGKIQTQDGATAKLTFGPSPFDAVQEHSGLFVVVYDKSGINGAPAPGKAGKALPEPMCAPEGVLTRSTDLGAAKIVLRYALDADQRPMWLATDAAQPSAPARLFDPQDCHLRGVPARRNPR
jgi:hypothetical protein